MKNIRELYRREQHPVRVLQIGEGNFLRAFVDYAIDAANEENGFDGNVAIVMPRARKTSGSRVRTISTPSACADRRTASRTRRIA